MYDLYQLWGPSPPPNLQGPMAPPTALSSQTVIKPLQENSSGISLEPPSSEAKPSGRKELPEVIIININSCLFLMLLTLLLSNYLQDLFMALYPPAPAPAPVPGWQTGPHLGMIHGLQYPNAAVCATAHGHLGP